MEYNGKLYGKVGKTYFPLLETTEDFDKIKSDAKKLKKENTSLREYILKGHRDILSDFCENVVKRSSGIEITNNLIEEYLRTINR